MEKSQHMLSASVNEKNLIVSDNINLIYIWLLKII